MRTYKDLGDPAACRREVAKALLDRDDFLVVSHVRPDGDCVGSSLALFHAFKALGKKVDLYNPSPIPLNLQFLPGSEAFLGPEQLKRTDYATTVFLDCSGIDRVQKGFKGFGYVINVDHHPTNEIFGELNFVDPKATSVGEQMYQLLEDMKVPLTKSIADPLLLAIMSDTGCFRYPSTQAQTFRAAARLVECGASPSGLSQEFYETRQPQSLVLAGKVLADLHFECDGTLVWGEITQAMYREAGGEDQEPDGLVSDIRGMRGVEVSLLVHELAEGGLRVGFRSKGTVNVSTLAQKIGGGGHHNASGAYIQGDYTALKKKVLDISVEHIREELKAKGVLPAAAPSNGR